MAQVPGGYPAVSEAHLEIARSYSSPALQGPRMCPELLAFVAHLYTEEEAEVVRHMRPWRPRTAASLAKSSGVPLEDVKRMLAGLAHEKYILASAGSGARERFMLMPVVPGTFESVLVRPSAGDAVSPWHRRFAELYEALYATGFTTEYIGKPVEAIRYLPVGEVIREEPMALPSDRLEVILERWDDFSIGVCQCRLSRQVVGEGCGRMLETCTVMGPLAPKLAEQGRMRRASMNDVLEVKAAAEKEGLVTWMMNSESSRIGNCACSCCGCCCGALRTVSEFDAPGMIAPPHFMPRIDPGSCTGCGKCAAACQMKALVMLGEGREARPAHRSERCIGCGLCSVTCGKGSVRMSPVPGYRKPPAGWLSHLIRYVPRYVSNFRHVRRARETEGGTVGGR